MGAAIVTPFSMPICEGDTVEVEYYGIRGVKERVEVTLKYRDDGPDLWRTILEGKRPGDTFMYPVGEGNEAEGTIIEIK